MKLWLKNREEEAPARPAAFPGGITRYVLVVHGIGEQRKNETVLSVISRLAEARRGLGKRESQDVLTLGMACAQTGKDKREGDSGNGLPDVGLRPWMEFEGIPQSPGSSTASPFLGEPSHNPGENLRFVEVTWSDVMQDDFRDIGQSPEVWAEGLLGRLQRKSEWARRNGATGGRVPAWALHLLELVKETVVYLRWFTRWRARSFDDLVFSRFLGDVQLYGEYAPTRGLAIRRFHWLMHRIEVAHEREQRDKPAAERTEARYSIIAHSLGSIMSFDALLYAHVKPEIRLREKNGFPNLPFPAYAQGDRLGEQFKQYREHRAKGTRVEDYRELDRAVGFVDTGWVQRVDAFVTLGSPIDKFLVLWWLNYEYLVAAGRRSSGWMDEGLWRWRRRHRITHLNYCDEQDPVGHKLDVAATAPAYQVVFDLKEDKVYNRFTIPGLAHLSYWKDLELFQRILRFAIDYPEKDPRKEPQPEDFWLVPKIYGRVLTYSYRILPLTMASLAYLIFVWAWYADSLRVTAATAILLFGTVMVGRRLIDLGVWWRQIAKAKDREALIRGEPEARTREQKGRRFRHKLAAAQYLSLALAGLATGFYVFGVYQYGWQVQWRKALLVALVATIGTVAWYRLFRVPEGAWEDPRARGLNERVAHLYLELGLLLTLFSFAGVLVAFRLWSWALGKGFLLLQIAGDSALHGPLQPRLPHLLFNAAVLLGFVALGMSYVRGRLLWLRRKVRPYTQAKSPDALDFSLYVETFCPEERAAAAPYPAELRATG